MSELTRCNRCTLEAVKRRERGKRVTTKRDEHGWLRVHVDGEPIGISFLELTDHCVC